MVACERKRETGLCAGRVWVSCFVRCRRLMFDNDYDAFRLYIHIYIRGHMCPGRLGAIRSTFGAALILLFTGLPSAFLLYPLDAGRWFPFSFWAVDRPCGQRKRFRFGSCWRAIWAWGKKAVCISKRIFSATMFNSLLAQLVLGVSTYNHILDQLPQFAHVSCAY